MDINQFTREAQQAAFHAQRLARDLDHDKILPEHLLLSLLTQEDRVIADLITISGGQLKDLTLNVQQALKYPAECRPASHYPMLCTSSEKLFNQAHAEAQSLGEYEIGTEHLLMALMHIRSTADLLAEAGVTRENIVGSLQQVRAAHSSKPDWWLGSNNYWSA